MNVALNNFAYDIAHANSEIHLDFGLGSDVCQRVWFGWIDPGFEVTVETWFYRGTIPASRLYPAEHEFHHIEDSFQHTRLKDVIDTLQREHGIDLLEAV